jgi:hypothetical protein
MYGRDGFRKKAASSPGLAPGFGMTLVQAKALRRGWKPRPFKATPIEAKTIRATAAQNFI